MVEKYGLKDNEWFKLLFEEVESDVEFLYKSPHLTLQIHVKKHYANST